MGWAINNIDIAHNGAMENFRANAFMRNGENGDKWGVAVLINSMDPLTLELLGEVPYGNISFDIIQLLHGQKPSNNYSPFKITFSNIHKVAKVYLYYLLATLLLLTSSLRNILKLK